MSAPSLSSTVSKSQTPEIDLDPTNAHEWEELRLLGHRMVDDMLDISKLEAGLLGVWRRPCSVREMINNVAGLVGARAQSKQIQLSTRCPDDLPLVYCDDEKAQRVLINLTVNAVKFTPEKGKVDLWVRLSDDGEEVTIGVTDSGPGISASNLEVIFQRFKQHPPLGLLPAVCGIATR